MMWYFIFHSRMIFYFVFYCIAINHIITPNSKLVDILETTKFKLLQPNIIYLTDFFLDFSHVFHDDLPSRFIDR